MNYHELGISAIQIIGTAGLVLWMLRRNTVRLDQIAIDMAVVKSVLVRINGDHDNLILLAAKQEKIEKDLNNAHEKIRRVVNG